MKVQQILILSTDAVSLMVATPFSSVCYNPASTSNPMPQVNYNTVFDALVDGWKLLSQPIKETDEEGDVYNWWFAKEEELEVG